MRRASVWMMAAALMCASACGPNNDDEGSGTENNTTPTTSENTSTPTTPATTPSTTPIVDMGDTNPPDPDMGMPDDMGETTPPVDDMDMGQTTPPVDMPTEVDMPPAGTTATMRGTITRSASPMAGGIGDLYIALLDGNPMFGGNPNLVATLIIEDVDMNDPNVMIAYEITEIPTSTQAYYYTAFLDDNMSTDPNDPNSAGPDRGDLLSLDGFSVPQITLSMPVVYDQDIDLNANLPF